MRLRLDPFIIALLVAAVVASFVPATGSGLDLLKHASLVAIGLLFFLYGARLSTAETIAGLKHWRLHAAILSTTFVAFPLLGLGAQVLEPGLLTPGLANGVLLLCLVPSTVQSCVVYTRMARGNVAGAVVSASLSNLIGVFLTPALVALLMTSDAHVDAGAVVRIVLQLFVPFVLGQLLRPFIGAFIDAARRPAHGVRPQQHRARGLRRVQRGRRRRHLVDPERLGRPRRRVRCAPSCWRSRWAGPCCSAACSGSRALTGSRCCSAAATRAWRAGCRSRRCCSPGPDVALIVLPLMLYHQMQIITGAVVAGRLARNTS